MTTPDFGTIEFLDVAFTDCDLNRATRWVLAATGGSHFSYVVTPNVDHLVTYHDAAGSAWHRSYCTAVCESDLCLNDSRVLQRLSWISGERLPVAPGSDLAREVVAARRGSVGSISLVGGTVCEARWLAEVMPLHKVYHFDPPMGVRDDPQIQYEIAHFVERTAADVVFFAIGAPQSEIVANAIARRGLARGVALCIGASIEFLSGTKRRAPRWMQLAGIEWLFRLGSEPARLWRRYLVNGPRIFRIWAKAQLRRGLGAIRS